MTLQPGTPDFKEWLDKQEHDLNRPKEVYDGYPRWDKRDVQALINGCRLAERYREALNKATHAYDCDLNRPEPDCLFLVVGHRECNCFKQALTPQSIEGGK